MINVHEDPNPDTILENCIFCRSKTTYWTSLDERTPGQQVACCQSCASSAMPEDVPTKSQWIHREHVANKRFY